MVSRLTRRQDSWNHSDTKPRGASTKRKSVKSKTSRGRNRPRIRR